MLTYRASILLSASLMALNAAASEPEGQLHASLGPLPAVTAPAQAIGEVPDSAQPPQVQTGVSGANVAYAATTLDGVSTAVGLAGSAVEMNPLFSSLTPAGAVAVTAVKLGLLNHADKNMTGKQRESTLKNASGFFGGAGINNLFVIAGAATGVSVVAGLVSGYWFYNDTEKRLKAERRAKRLALRQQREREQAAQQAREAESQAVATLAAETM